MSLIVFLIAWDTKNGLRKKGNNTICVMDIFAQNNSAVVVDYVKFISSVEVKTFTDIAANGGGGSGVLQWDTNISFSISVKLKAYPGNGAIKIYNGQNLVYCTSFSNVSTSIIHITPDDIGGYTCTGGFLVFIETSGC